MIWVDFRQMRPHPAPAGEVPDRAEGEYLSIFKNNLLWQRLSARLKMNKFFYIDDNDSPSVAARHLPHEWGEDALGRTSGSPT